MNLVDDIVDRWRQRGVAMLPGVSDSGVVAFERRYAVAMPADFRGYLQRANGTGHDTDDDLFRFWPIEEIKPVEIELAGSSDSNLFPGCFVFADYGINMWLYAIQLQGDSSAVGRVYLVEVNGRRGAPIAASFSDWVALYLSSPEEIFPGGPPPNQPPEQPKENS